MWKYDFEKLNHLAVLGWASNERYLSFFQAPIGKQHTLTQNRLAFHFIFHCFLLLSCCLSVIL